MKVKDINPKCQKYIIIISAVAVALLGIGVYINCFQSNKRIIAQGLDNISTTIKDKLIMNTKDINIGNDYTMNGDLSLNIESDYLKQLGNISSEYQTYSTLITNLSKTKNKIIIKQDSTNKKAFIGLNSNYNGSDLIDLKYLIEDNTEYYYIKGFMDTYINNGTSNYFESLNSDSTNLENVKYIYDVALTSLKKNLKDEYFTKKSVKENIDNKEKNYQKITLSINNKVLKELATAILNDLKNDKKANKILTSIDSDFKNAKIKSNESYLQDNEKIEFSVYADNFTYSIKKYELSIWSDSNTNIYTLNYIIGTTRKIELYNNKKLQGYLDISTKDDKTIINVIDESSKNIGNITITKTTNIYNVNININIEDIKVAASVESKISNIVKNKSYNQNLILKASATSNGSSIGRINITMKNKVKKGVKINEDTTTAVLASDVSQEKTEAFMSSLMTSLTTLMS